MIIKWLNHACVKITSDSGKIIYFDPYELKGKMERADIILVSHDHFDHCSFPDIQKISGKNTAVIIPSTCSLDGDFKTVKLKNNESTVIDSIKIEAVPAYTANLNTHPEMNRWHGYVVNIDGKNIYHAGDTGKIKEMEELEDIHVAFVPVGGKYTMGFEEAAESVRLINPKIAVPIHNWDKPLEPFRDFVKNLCPNVRVEILSEKDLEI